MKRKLWGVSALICLGLAAGPIRAEDPPEKFQIFGYLTQAYGRSSRGSILGTERDGTTDLGNVALQFRWNKSDRETVVVQLAHERRGDDLFLPKNEDVDIDWAFYERRLGSYTALKIGRLNIPLGIYNEVRDVGTLLPFFNLPISFYPGVLSSAETVDGISLSHTLAARSEWALDTDLYFGGWDTVQQRVSADSEFGLINLDARAEDGLGVQLWLNTPVQGLRLGTGANTWILDGPVSGMAKNRWKSYHVSVDMAGDRWLFRAETRHWHFDLDFGAFFDLPSSLPGEAHRDGFYLQAGAWVTGKLGVFAQFEKTSIDDEVGLFPRLDDFHEEAALSLNFRFDSDFLARIEFYTAETRLPLGRPGGGGVGADPEDVDWAIVALSISF